MRKGEFNRVCNRMAKELLVIFSHKCKARALSMVTCFSPVSFR